MNLTSNSLPDRAKATLDIWKLIELLTPEKNESLTEYLKDAKKIRRKQCVDIAYKRDRTDVLFLLDQAPFNESLAREHLEREGYETQVSWHVYVKHLYWSEVEDAIAEKVSRELNIGSDAIKIKDSKTASITPIAAFIINNEMQLDPKSFKILSGAWTFGKIMQLNLSDDRFDELLSMDIGAQISTLTDKVLKEYLTRKINIDAINDIASLLMHELGIDQSFVIGDLDICIRKVRYQKSRLNEALDSTDTQNNRNEKTESTETHELGKSESPFLADLDLVRHKMKLLQPKSALNRYLGMGERYTGIDVLQDKQSLLDLCHNDVMHLATWPSAPQHSPALLQSAAINAILKQQKEDCRQLFAINGPPGTGKTTTMFDLIANIYVNRALAMANMDDPTKAFIAKHSYDKGSFTYYTHSLTPELLGYEMVIASANNKAVENISEQLSLYAKIDEIYRPELKLFNWGNKKGKKLVKEWGTFAAVLGNATNKQNFSRKFWQRRLSDKLDLNEDITMLQYLRALKGGADNELKYILPEHYASAAEIKLHWSHARRNFNKVLQDIKSVQQSIQEVNELQEKRDALLGEYRNSDLSEVLADKIEQQKCLTSISEYHNAQLKSLEDRIRECDLGIFKVLHKIFKSKRHEAYQEQVPKLLQDKTKLLGELTDNKLQLALINTEILKIKALAREVDKIDAPLLELFNSLKTKDIDSSQLDGHLFWTKPRNELHKSIANFNTSLKVLKANLFIAAVNLHEAFIAANARYFYNNMHSFINILDKNDIRDTEMIKDAWQSFFMIVPVVSTTLHSFSRLFACFDHENIGWLIVDEAGQVSPQRIVGALYRTRNAVIVGDPFQTEPISVLGDSLINTLFSKCGLDAEAWSPSYVSAQVIADRNARYQTRYDSAVVGFPLLVHRRCNEPMFSICNEMTYEGQMISVVEQLPSQLTEILGRSRWIDVEDSASDPNGYESLAEFKSLLNLLETVLKQQDGTNLLRNIYIITIYKGFQQYIINNLRKEFAASPFIDHIKYLCYHNVGTIHAFQGKENDTVILMLGAQHPKHAASRYGMTKKSNVLNVAVSRAKKNLYVIGSKEKWTKYENMYLIMQGLHNYYTAEN